jgi:DNA-binding transcriptional ArsR family regulator
VIAASPATAAKAGEVFAALADATRWRLLTLLAARGEGTATTLASEMPVSRPAVVKHLAVLDRAGLVRSRRAGKEVRFTVQPERLDETARWLAALASEWDARLAAIKRIAEAASPSAKTGGETGGATPEP